MLFRSANWLSIAEVFATAAVGIAALAAGFQGWALKRTTLLERWMFIIAGFALVYPGWVADILGFGLVAVALVLQLLRKQAQPPLAT